MHLLSLITKSPKGVFIFFSAGVIGPSILLGFLGLRSFRYETELLRQENSRRFEKSADEIQAAAQQTFETPLNDLSLRASLVPPGSSEVHQNLFETNKVAGYPILAMFLFDEQGRILIPKLDLPSLTPLTDFSWGPLEEEVRALEKLEFKDKRIKDAADGYLRLAKEARLDVQKLALLKNAAAAFRKINRINEVEEIYKDIFQRFNGIPDVTGQPAGFLAGQRLIDVYETTSQHDKAESTRLAIAEALASGDWSLNPSDEKHFFDEIQPRSKDVSVQPAWRLLTERMKRREDVTEKAKTFVRTSWPRVFQSLISRGWRDKGGVLFNEDSTITIESNKVAPNAHSLSVVAPLSIDPKTNRRGFLVAIIPAAPVITTLQQILNQTTEKSGLTWKSIEKAHKLNNRDLTLGFLKGVDTVDPPLILRLAPPSNDLATVLLKRRIRIYGSMSALSILVTLAGLGLMFHAIRREKENADLKAEFVSNVSHEIRTPLTAIAYIAERLKMGQYKSIDEVKEFYGMLGDEASQLTEMVESILDFSRIMGGRKTYDRRTENLVEVVQIACERFRGKALANGFRLSRDLPATPISVAIDRKAVIQAILNLLDNALKYSGESKEISVRVTTSDQFAKVAIQDHGMGIARQEHEKIFEKFYRVESAMRRTSTGGVGLGLAIVKHTMTGHGGHVSVESEEGQGSTFYLSFYLRSPALITENPQL